MNGGRRQYRSGSVFQRNDGMWIGRFEAGRDRDGKRRRITVSATSEQRCKEKLEEKKLEIARHGVPEHGSLAKISVDSWATQWLDIVVDDQRPKSFATTRSAITKWIIPTIGRKRLDHLTLADVRAVQDAQRKAGRAESSRRRTHSVLMSMLKDAVREGHYVPDQVFHARKPKVTESDREAIPLDQSIALLRAAADMPDASKWAAVLLQGLRQGERLGLTWDAIDHDQNVLDISWQLQQLPYIDNRQKELGPRVPDGYVHRHLEGRFYLVRPKSKKSRRIIPMVPWMAQALDTWREVAPASPHGLVWTRPDGRPVDAADDREEWRALQARAGVAHPAGRPYVGHEGRHATATLLLELGVDKTVVEAILGHSRFVESYNHSRQLPAQRRALEQLAAQLALEVSDAR